jgi:hypothetical protein
MGKTVSLSRDTSLELGLWDIELDLNNRFKGFTLTTPRIASDAGG